MTAVLGEKLDFVHAVDMTFEQLQKCVRNAESKLKRDLPESEFAR